MVRKVLFATVASALVLATVGCAPVPPAGETPSSEVGELDQATLQYLKDNANALAGQLGIDNPPEVKPVRLIRLQEYASAQVECLQGAGYEASLTEDGEGVTYPVISDPALQESFNLAIYTCELEYPVQQRYMVPLTDEGLKMLYAYRTGELITCLEGLGYNVSSEAPSETVFVQSGGMWSPYETLAIRSDDVKQTSADCPQPPDDVYGR